MTPTEARAYISKFHLTAGCPPIQYVDTSTGRRILIEDMSDEDAVAVAKMMMDIEVEAVKRGATKQ